MDKSKMMRQLMTTFLEELEEHVRAFNQDLLALEKEPPAGEQAERFKTLFRTAHSLKGAARSVNVGLIEGACHRLEEILTQVRDGQQSLAEPLFELLFATVDAIEESGMRLREQQDLADAPLAALFPRLDAAAAGIPPPAPPCKGGEQEAPPLQGGPPASPPSQRGASSSPPLQGGAGGGETLRPPEATASRPSIEPPVESAASVRVSAEKLDTLLARVGELMVAQRRVEARTDDLVAVVDFVDQWKNEWKQVERLFTRESPTNGNGSGTMERGPRGLSRHAAFVLRQNGDKLRHLEKSLDRLRMAMSGDVRLLEQVTRPLDDEVRRVRMLPFSDACAGLDRMARDLAQAAEKDIELRIEGGSVEMDRSILEGLKDPLRHLVRNAIDHGMEPSSQRLAAAKSRRGQIKISAALHGAQVEVRVADDGRGLDLDAIRAQARRRKLEEPADERDVARLIFQPGFSTASIITDVSGRGVGLDVVKNRVEALHGTVDLDFTPGQGTQFALTVPLTLTTLRAVLVVAGDQTYAFAGTNIHKMLHIHAEDVRTVAGREVLSFEGAPLPLATLATVLNLAAATEAPARNIPVIVVAAGTSRMAFRVDGLVAEQEILIKNLGTRIRRTPLVAGATLLPSGQLALVLNAANLVRSVLSAAAVGATFKTRGAEQATEMAAARKRLLVVEDSVTTRTLMKSILEAAGYEVFTAIDGQAGWQFLQDHEVDLIVSDVDMPHMDGFELTAAVRSSKRWAALPMVLVTARETDRDRARGIEVGANAYLVKSAFDQRNLLESIAQLL